MYVDIKKAEWEVICAAIDILNKQTRTIMIATYIQLIQNKCIDPL